MPDTERAEASAVEERHVREDRADTDRHECRRSLAVLRDELRAHLLHEALVFGLHRGALLRTAALAADRVAVAGLDAVAVVRERAPKSHLHAGAVRRGHVVVVAREVLGRDL